MARSHVQRTDGMNEIRFLPLSDDGEQEFGDFTMRVADCIAYLMETWASHSIAMDSELLDWIRNSPLGSVVPNRFDFRARYMVASLVQRTACRVSCRICRANVEPGTEVLHEWTDTADVGGITVGSAGHRIECPIGHVLLIVSERVF